MLYAPKCRVNVNCDIRVRICGKDRLRPGDPTTVGATPSFGAGGFRHHVHMRRCRIVQMNHILDMLLEHKLRGRAFYAFSYCRRDSSHPE
jgi:hypothetical protein